MELQFLGTATVKRIYLKHQIFVIFCLIHLTNFILILLPKRLRHLASRSFLCLEMIAEISKIMKWKKERNLSPSTTLSHTITKKPKRVNFRCKSHRGFWSSEGSSMIALSLDFTVIRVLFRFLFDRTLFRVLSDRVFFESSEIVLFSLGSAAANRFFSSSMLFFHHVAIFYQIVLLLFLSKTDTLFSIHYNSQKQLV